LAFLFRLISYTSSYKAKSPVLSVGNFIVGGSGKTPLVIEVAKYLKSKDFSPVVVTKSYKASLKKPSEVLLGSDPLIFGDEAVSLKESLEDVLVISGPSKSETIKHFDSLKESETKRVYILDDGAQHHKIYKDVKIHVWDMTRSLLDIFPFPLGMSREFWFLGEKPTFSVLNRYREDGFVSGVVKGEKLKAHYSVETIKNVVSGEDLSSGFTLISGLGNFKQLKNSVNLFIKEKPFLMHDYVQGKDHDDFSWFKAVPGLIYVCTQKDKAKLVDRISSDSLYIVESGYNKDFKEDLLKALNKALKGMI